MRAGVTYATASGWGPGSTTAEIRSALDDPSDRRRRRRTAGAIRRGFCRHTNLAAMPLKARRSLIPDASSGLLRPHSSDRVTYEIEQQFLKLDDLRADATA